MSAENLKFPYPKQALFYQGARELVGNLTHLLKIKVTGTEFIQPQTPTIYSYFPHTGHGDSVVIHHVLKNNGVKNIITPAAKDYWFRNIWTALLANTTMPAFPLHRESGPRQTHEDLDCLITMLNSGFSALISPEGTRSNKLPEERKLKRGVAYLASKTGFPIVPIVIVGYEDVWPRGRKLPNPFETGLNRKKVTVCFSNPLQFGKIDKDKIIADLRQIFLTTYHQISTLTDF